MGYKTFTALSMLLACSAFAEDVIDKATGESFPAEVSFDYEGKEYQLEATGVSTRKKLIVKVYSVAHYLQKDAEDAENKLQAILSDKNAKQLTIKWVRAVPAEKVQEGYHESLKMAIPDQSQLQSAIKTYLAFFNRDVQKGDEHIIRWIPGGVIEVEINGTRAGTVTSPEFAKGLWMVWFGDKSVVNRDALLNSK